MPQTIRPCSSRRLEARRLDAPERVAQVVGQRQDVVELVARIDCADRVETAHAVDLRFDRLAGRRPWRLLRRRPPRRSEPPRRSPRRAPTRRAFADRDARAKNRAARRRRPRPTRQPSSSTDSEIARPVADLAAGADHRARGDRRARRDRALGPDERPAVAGQLGLRPCPRGCPSSPAGSAPACRCPSSSRRACARRGPGRRAAGRPRARSTPPARAGSGRATERSST